MPEPELSGGMHLVQILFQVGPARADSPLTEQDLEPWERRRGIELPPWQAEVIVSMSRAYLAEMHSASKISATAPWPKAQKMWSFVCAEKLKKQKAQEENPDGRSQRRRNPPPG